MWQVCKLRRERDRRGAVPQDRASWKLRARPRTWLIASRQCSLTFTYCSFLYLACMKSSALHPAPPPPPQKRRRRKRAILQQLQLYFHFLVAAGSERDQIQPGANPLSQTAGSAQALCCLCVTCNWKLHSVFLTGHWLSLLPNYSFVSLPMEANQTSENALLTTVSALGCSLCSPGVIDT